MSTVLSQVILCSKCTWALSYESALCSDFIANVLGH
jgi:hypothetical protein